MEWDLIDLDEKLKYDNRIIQEVIKVILDETKYNSFVKSCLLCEITKHISDKNLFNSTKELFKSFPFYEKTINNEYIVFLDDSFKTCFTIYLGGNEVELKYDEVDLKSALFRRIFYAYKLWF